MTRLSLQLPAVPGAADPDPLAWLLAAMRTGRPPFRHCALDAGFAGTGAIRLGAGDAWLEIVPAAERSASSAATVPIVPGLALTPPDPESLIDCLTARAEAIDHVGISLSQRDLDGAAWEDFIARLAAFLPAWRLEIGSANDIVMIVCEGAEGERAAAIELVHDRTAPFSSVHLCLAMGCDRAELEARLPPPLGGAKPGDEPFFRSVALPPSLAVPAYLDLAFSDGEMTPWPAIVRAMGKRIGRAAPR
ncbi:hypothetical protein [Flavisphingomonas formosensis]|uniref:hypothetical protein n=1 Tax=Flavisphingomonas formosensis TaxID=861534 RepID=UPI0012FB8AB6|nr:hypothetical protein [Sphingomonas formosensis]